MIEKLPDLKLAITLWNAEDHAAARAEFERVVEAQPQNETAWLWMARTAVTPYQQWRALQEVLLLNPENDVAQKALEKRFPPPIRERFAKIEEMLSEAVFADDWRSKQVLYEEVLALDPQNEEALKGLLDEFRAERQWGSGLRMLTQFRQQFPERADLVRQEIDFAIELGDLTALMELSDVLLNHPAVTVAQLLAIAALFAKSWRYDIVLHLLERAAALDPSNQTVLYGLARAYEANHQPAEAQRIMQRITDLDRKSKLGQSVMSRLLEHSPYVPLSMRQNVLVAVREAVGIMLPFALLAWLDHRLQLAIPVPILGIGLALVGAYLLVSATSSHEQVIFRPWFTDGLDETTRTVVGIAGGILLVMAAFLTMNNSFQEADNFDHWRQESCLEFVTLLQEDEYYGDDTRAFLERYSNSYPDKCVMVNALLIDLTHQESN